MGTSEGEPSRREIRSENHTRPGQHGATNSRRTPSRRTLIRTPGSRAIGGKAYRRSLGHVCTIASSPMGAGGIRENKRGHCAFSCEEVHLYLIKHSPYLLSPPRGEASIPRASAPVSTVRLVPHSGTQE